MKEASPTASLGKRRRGPLSPSASSPSLQDGPEPPQKVHKIPRGGRRGAALLRAAGVTEPVVASKILHTSRSASQPASAAKSRAAVVPAAKLDPLHKQPLPPKLTALEDIFSAVHTVHEMLKRRGKRTTFANMKAAVEEASRRRFTEAHLTQLQSLLPDVITLETVNLPVTQRSTRTEANLLVTLTTTEGPAALRAELHVKLARHLLHSYTAFLRETAAEARKAGDAEKAAEMEQEAALTGPVTEFRAPYPDAVPDYKVAAPKVASPLPADTTAHATASGSQGATSSEDATAPLKATSGAVAGTVRPTAAPGGVTLASGAGPRRLSFTGLDASEEASLLEVMPEGLRSRSKDGVISMASLKKLEGNEREFMRWSSKAAQDDRGVRAALGALPATYSRLRRIFGPRGPSALKLDAVVDKIRGGGAETTSKEEVVAQLQTLAERAPEFVELKAWGPCGTPAVWINRRCDLNALAGKLKAAAQTRLSGVAGAEAGVVVKV